MLGPSPSPSTSPSAGGEGQSSAGTSNPASPTATSNTTTSAGTVPSTTSPGSNGSPAAVPSSSAGANNAPTPVQRYGQLRVSGNQLLAESGEVAVLRGQGFGWDNWWPQFYNADVVAWLKSDWCVDIVRPAMGIEPEGAYLDNPAASRARIEAVVDAAIEQGLYVIIDWHAHDLHQAESLEFFSGMAMKYGSHPNVLYEIFNEPDEESWEEVKAYAEAVIGAIREHDPDNLVIVGSPEWDQRIDLVAADPITSHSNILYSVHFYAATHTEWLQERTAAALADGIPVIVSESSGSEASGMGDNDYEAWQAWFDFMESNGISWLNYAIADKSGETISVLVPGAAGSGGWDTSQLTESGQYIRDVFRKHCP